MALSDLFNMNTPQGMGLMGFANAMGRAAMPSRMPISFGAALGSGAGGLMQGYAQGQQNQLRQQQIQTSKLGMLMKLRQMQAAAGMFGDKSLMQGLGGGSFVAPQPAQPSLPESIVPQQATAYPYNAASSGAAPMPQTAPQSAPQSNPFILNGLTPKQAEGLYFMNPGAYMSAITSQFAPTDMVKNMRAAGIDPNSALGKQVMQNYVAKQNYIAPMNVRPGGTVFNPTTGKPEFYSPRVAEGAVPTFGPNGQVTGVKTLPGAPQAAANVAGATQEAKSRAEAGYQPTTLNLPNGNNVLTTKRAVADQVNQQAGVPATTGTPQPAVNNNLQITPQILDSLRHVESRGQAGEPSYALSSKGAMGPYQITPAKYADLVKQYGPFNPFDESQTRPIVQKDLSRMSQEFGSVQRAVAAWQSGEQAVKDSGGIPNTTDGNMTTPQYTQTVMSGAQNASQVPGIPVAGETQNAENQAYGTNVGKAFAKQYGTIQDAAQTSRQMVNKIAAINNMLEGLNTGSLTPAMTSFQSLAQSVGLDISPNTGKYQAAQALSNQLALQLRNPAAGAGMPGSLSDSDRRFLTSSVPNLAMTPQGRHELAGIYEKVSDRAQHIAAMADEYVAKNGKLDSKFNTEVRDYANANPLFGKKSNPLVKNADGTYTYRPSTAGKLVPNADGSYTYTVH